MSRGTAQLALDLGHRPAFGREDFMVAPCNAAAVAWLDRWPDWPAPALVLYGPAGCGKSHLVQVWRVLTGAIGFARSNLAVPGLAERLGEARAVYLEDAETGIDERGLLHLYNMLAERGGHLLLTASLPAARWALRLADLRSRLLAVPAVAVAAPDEALIAAVLVKLFADRQLRVSAGLVAYLVTHMERSFDAARRLVAALDRAALAGRRRVTVPLARAVLAELGDGGQ
jgi:chromosomal replication initiation ATPase DnaA